MLFNSFTFILFFVAITTLYFATPYRFRWLLLLAGSYFFYGYWKVEYLLLIMGSTLIDYSAARVMTRSSDPGRRRGALIAAISANLAILGTFKYLNFFCRSAEAGLSVLGIQAELPLLVAVLPVGISFYTFQSMAYSIDVYRGRVASERRLGLFALYIAFFPQLVAGPIERPAHLLPQLREHHDFDVERLRLGLMQMLWGFFQKVVIADNISLIVDTVYEQPEAYAPGALAVATYLFAIQIYCDFGGYSNIAIGAARILGIDLMENFDRPYLSQSIPEFWRRWHISLSTWFRDYVYIPLGGNRQRWVANIAVVFLLSGLWHGAAITFVIWGALHGAAMVVDNAWRARRAPTPHDSRFGRIWRVAITFHIVCAGWIFFRSESLADAWLIIGRLVAPLGVEASAWPSGIAPLTWVVAGGGAMLLMVLELTQGDVPWWRRLLVAPRGLRWTAYLLLSLAILNLGVSRSVPFMYFQF